MIDYDRLAALCPVADEGLRRAGRGLSEMAGVPIETTAARVRRLPLAAVPNLVGGPDVVVAGVYLAIKGRVEGHMLLMLSVVDACELVDMLLELPMGTTTELDELGYSALGEVGNVVGSFFLAALADATALRLLPSPTSTIVDMSGAILDVVLAELSVEGDEVLVIDTVFTQRQQRVNAFFLVLPRQCSLDVILGSLPC